MRRVCSLASEQPNMFQHMCKGTCVLYVMRQRPAYRPAVCMSVTLAVTASQFLSGFPGKCFT